MIRACLSAVAAAAVLASSASAFALTGYGVTANGTLFSFDVDAAASATTVGSMGIVPEAIDFRPANGKLYAVDVGPTNTTVYTVNTATAAITSVGTFPSSASGGSAYNLTNGLIGMDFNPVADRIRIVTSTGVNLRINPDTAAVAAVDAAINPGTPFISASAYSNNLAGALSTTLYDFDSNSDSLLTQNPPNNGTVTTIGPFGVTVNAVNTNAGFDIYTDPTTFVDRGLVVFQRPDVALLNNPKIAVPNGPYMLYEMNLSTGGVSNGRLVGGGLDFSGGFAVTPGSAVPEPASLALIALAAPALLFRRRRV
jgi:hypothetical protein